MGLEAIQTGVSPQIEVTYDLLGSFDGTENLIWKTSEVEWRKPGGG